MYINIFDKGGHTIDQLSISHDNFMNVKKIKDVPLIDDGYKKLVKSLDYLVVVFSFDENDDEFYLSYIDNKIMKHSPINSNLRGMSISTICPDKKSNIIKLLKNVHSTDVSEDLFFEYYTDNDILFQKFKIKIVNIDGFIYILSKETADYSSLLVEQKDLFNNDVTPIIIIQNSCIVKCNDKYLKLFGYDNQQEVLGNKIDDIEDISESIDYVTKKFDKVLNEKISSYTFPFNNNKNNNLLYFNITAKYIVYCGEPAVLCIFEDITEQEINRLEAEKNYKEASFFKNNIELIQSATDTGISYYFNQKEVLRSSMLYEIVERSPKPSDRKQDITYEFIIDDDLHILDENYKKLKSGVGTVNFIIRIRTAKGNLKYVKCYMKEKYENNKLIEHLSCYKDITEEQIYINDLKNALDESNKLKENLKHLQRISKSAISYTNNQGTLDWTPASFDMLNYDYEDYKDYHGAFFEIIIDEDLNRWEETFNKCSPSNPEANTVVRVINNEGNIVYIKIYIICYYDKNGNHIGHANFYQDITEDIKRENKLKEALNDTLKLQENINIIQKLSKTAIGYSENAIYSKWTPEIYDILEINPKEYENKMDNIIKRFVIPEDLKVRKESILHLSPTNPDVTFTQRIKTGKGNIKHIKTIIHHIYDKSGNIIDRISFNQDITHEIEYDNQLKTALKDKEVLLTEVHHRVKNNLQIILSLINLNKNFDTNPDTILLDTENRIYAMALIHEKIYVSSSLSQINIKEYVESLVYSLLDMYQSNIKFHSKMKDIELNMEEAIPIGLIINELITNTIKYAFPNDYEGNLYIYFDKEYKKYTLLVQDDGIGLPKDFNLNTITSMGLMVVQNLVLQLGGNINILESEGTGIKIEFYEEE